MSSETEAQARRWLATADAESRRNERRVRTGFWPKLKRFLARLPMAEEFVAAYYAAFDARTPTRVRATLLAALAYFILPFDLLPDIVVGLGFTDDLTVLLTAFRMVRAHMRPEHREAARRALDAIRAETA